MVRKQVTALVRPTVDFDYKTRDLAEAQIQNLVGTKVWNHVDDLVELQVLSQVNIGSILWDLIENQ